MSTPRLFSMPAKITRFDGIAFGITAKKYCPNHGATIEDLFSPCHDCYADKGLYTMPSVANAYDWRGKLTFRDDFVEIMNWELEKLKKRPKYFRIHDSGDFYSIPYLMKWNKIIEANPDIHFYCYTKEISKMLKMYNFAEQDDYFSPPKNFTVCFSYGGKEDHLINPDIHRHSYVFHDKDTLERCGFADASYDDRVIMNKENHRIGLIAH